MLNKVLPEKVSSALTVAAGSQTKVWLVGGAVRDFFMKRTTHDFDFAVAGDARRLARMVADRLGAAYYDLDIDRGTGRVLPGELEAEWRSLDFASLRAEDIQQDLMLRDFSVNALALPLQEPADLLDPTGGLAAIREGILRLCHPSGLSNDPVRAVRAVRLSAELGFQLDRQLAREIVASHELVGQASVERVRAELFRMLALPRPAQALRVAQQLSLGGQLLPRLSKEQLIQGYQRQDHLARITAAIVGRHDEQATADWVTGQASVRLGRFRGKLERDLRSVIAGERNRRHWLFWAALYLPEGFPESTLHAILNGWRVSRVEISRLTMMSRGWSDYDRTPLIAAETKRTRYRFFNELGAAGVEVSLLALANTLAQQAGPPTQTEWEQQIERARKLLLAWYEGPEEDLHPAPLVRGDEIIQHLGISAGPLVGELIAAIREEQAVGLISSRQAALDLAERLYLERS